MKKSFTMIELIFVMLIVGILGIYVSPKFGSSCGDLAKERDKIISAIRYTRHLSQTYNAFDYKDEFWRNKSFCFEIDDTLKEFNISKSGVLIKDPLTKNDYSKTFDSSFNFNNLRLCFDNMGRPFRNNLDYANLTQNNLTLSLTCDSKNTDITIHKETGYIESNCLNCD